MHRSILTVLLVSGFASGSVAAADENCIRNNRVTGFAQESSASMLIRQSKDRYFRVQVPEGCLVGDPERVFLDTGLTKWVQGTNIPVRIDSDLATNRVCALTPNARLVAMDQGISSQRVHCKVRAIEPIEKEIFEVANPKRMRPL